MTLPITCREVNILLGLDDLLAQKHFADQLARELMREYDERHRRTQLPPTGWRPVDASEDWKHASTHGFPADSNGPRIRSDDVPAFNKRAYDPTMPPHKCLHNGDVVELRVPEDDADQPEMTRPVHVCRTCHSELQYDTDRKTIDCPHDRTAEFTRISGFDVECVCLLCRESIFP